MYYIVPFLIISSILIDIYYPILLYYYNYNININILVYFNQYYNIIILFIEIQYDNNKEINITYCSYCISGYLL